MSTPAPLGAAPPDAALSARARFVHDGFVASATWYDRLTRVFSCGLDGRWRRAGVEACALRPGEAVLDVATGTGELALAARRAVGRGSLVVGVDFCRPMLAEAQRKAARTHAGRVAWVHGRAEALPLRSATFDRVMLGFALRHVDDLALALREIVRVLRPGGRFVVVEWTRPEAAVPRWLLLSYMRWVVPPLVRLVSRDGRVEALAAYLPRSIARFMPGRTLGDRLEAAGLQVRDRRSYLGGLVSLCVSVKRTVPDALGAPVHPTGRQDDLAASAGPR